MKWIMVLLLVMCGCSADVKLESKPVQQKSMIVSTDNYTVKMTHGDGAYLVVNDSHGKDILLHCIGGYQEVKCDETSTTTDCTDHHVSEDWCHTFKPGEMIQLENWDGNYVYHSQSSRNESDYEEK